MQPTTLTYLGHSCFHMELQGKHLVFDPYIRGNVLAAEAGIDIDSVQADYILVSHGHDDHTADLVYLAERTGATVISSWEIYSWLNRQGITNGHPMNIGGSWNFEFGRVKMTFAAHSSSLADGTYAGVASGFLIESGHKTIYYSGDTALNLDMKLLSEFHKIDWALLPIGDNFTMNYEDACRASNFINCNKIVGMHYDTFGYIQVNHQEAINHFADHGKLLHLMPIGSQLEL